MTNTRTDTTLLDVMKHAAALVKEHDLRQPDEDGNDTDQRFQVNHKTWRDVFTWYEVPIPEKVLVRYVDGEPRYLGENGLPTAVRRASAVQVARPVEAEDGTLTITCVGPCGQTMPVTKFPTLKGGNARRGTTCRACEKAAREARKA